MTRERAFDSMGSCGAANLRSQLRKRSAGKLTSRLAHNAQSGRPARKGGTDMEPRQLTPSEQRERETIASRVYAAASSWESASHQAAVAQDREREMRALRDADPLSVSARITWELSDYEMEQASARHAQAWQEYQDALKVQDGFRMRTGACSCCGGPAVFVIDGELFCDECNDMLQREAEQREAEQQADYARTRGV